MSKFGTNFLNDLVNGPDSLRKLTEAQGGISDGSLTIKVVGAGNSPVDPEVLRAAREAVKDNGVVRSENTSSNSLPFKSSKGGIEI